MDTPSIPMVDLRAQHRALEPELHRRVMAVLRSGRFILGPEVQAFEEEVAAYLGVRHAVGVASGTDALVLALEACGVGPGDEVITTPFSFVATAEAIVRVGARPVFVDVQPHSFNLDPARLEAAITPRTRAIVPVHLFGRPADMEGILDVAARHGLKVVEDCAQAFGASLAAGKVGSLGDAGCYSFFPSKNLGACGDGGLVVTRDASVEARLRSLRNHGSRARYHHETLGYNSRLDEIQAAILRLKLPRVDTYNALRRSRARRYDEGLRELDLILPEPGEGEHVYHQYTIRSAQRDRIREALSREGIASAVYYPVPLHLQPAFRDLGYGPGDFPVSERLAREVLSLPMYPELPDQDVERICRAIRQAVGAG